MVQMTTADWALLISLVSALISLGGFVWNVWSKFIYPKPVVEVSFNFMTAMGVPDSSSVVVLSATNMGPSPVTLRNAVTRPPRKLRKTYGIGILNPLHGFPTQLDFTQGPFSGGLPKKVDVGEEFSLYFIPEHEALARDDVELVGFLDTFGRKHWASKDSVAVARKKIREALDKAGKKY
jgi:hypothetical protein